MLALLALLTSFEGSIGPAVSIGQTPAVPMIVDAEGVMRWNDSGEEVALFGVNYAMPFAFGYRAHGYIGADRKAAIDVDVQHMARLGLDAFRVHVWDREVTDKQGNLLENDHLDLLDYLLSVLSAHGIKTILTPIAWWPAGYPEPDPESSSISSSYSKGQMTTDPAALAPQQNYMRQFIAHNNPYTGHTYGNDPDILAIELFNEPSHPGTRAETTEFIDALVDALRDSGYAKPIFYNISQDYTENQGHAVCSANIQGVAGQWYPTGLVRGGTIGGNMLPNVDRYTVPWEDFPECQDKARMVYEYDAADVAGSYMYPAMARSFRGAGFQWATQFAYDPMAIAYSNTEYQTHYLNLVYTPAKAISYMIAGQVFRSVARGSDFGTYPNTERFGPYRVSHSESLSEMVADTVFYHSSSTLTAPPDPGALRHIAGTGSSPAVAYDGTGSYFLDRIQSGAWRLEVYPDAIVVADPFARSSISRHAVRILWSEWPMTIRLPDLPDFQVTPLNEGNRHTPGVVEGRFGVRPGVYLLTTPDVSAQEVSGRLGAANQAEFHAPEASLTSTIVLHEPPLEIPSGSPFQVRAQVASPTAIDSVALIVRRVGGRGLRPLWMVPGPAFTYEAEIPASLLLPGLTEYGIVVFQAGDPMTFPTGESGHPYDWDYTGGPLWQVPVTDPILPVVVFDAKRDLERVLYPHPWDYVSFQTEIVGGSESDRLALRAEVESLAPSPHNLSLRSFLPDQIGIRLSHFGPTDVMRIRARSAGAGQSRLEVALVQEDASAWGTVLTLSETWNDYVIPLEDLYRTSLALLPRPYPQFLPDRLESASVASGPDLSQLDGIQLRVAAEHFGADNLDGPHGFEIERVTLEKR